MGSDNISSYAQHHEPKFRRKSAFGRFAVIACSILKGRKGSSRVLLHGYQASGLHDWQDATAPTMLDVLTDNRFAIWYCTQSVKSDAQDRSNRYAIGQFSLHVYGRAFFDPCFC
ncbi:hypothetical protein MES5069_140067 [Mesorhizobium escarrei]|uniref:Alpha/beta hydrolase n=1 Tax=Mesorhizobium escarrei TaxID=666018 RepID=A0ABN8JHJ6_9HYPH|nr:hypothetical protein MES5069_140067 [Mesorhizobium escarrei]